MPAALTLAAKDLYLLARDRRTFAMLLILPLIFIAIIGTTTGKFPGLGGSGKVIRLAVVDRTDYAAVGEAGFADDPDQPLPPDVLPADPLPDEEADRQRTLIRNAVTKTVLELRERDGFRADTVDHWAAILADDLDGPLPDDPAAAARELLDRGLVDAAVTFAPDFARRTYTLGGTDLIFGEEETGADSLAGLGVSVTGDADGTGRLIRGTVEARLTRQLSPLIACRSNLVARQAGDRCAALDAEAGEPPLELPVSEVPTAAGPVADVYDELVPGYTVMFVFFLVNLMARSFLYERDLGTMRRLGVAPIRPSSILIGKTLPFFVISVAQTALLFLTGRLLFGMSWGREPWLLVPIMVCCSASATGLGLLIAAVVKSESQVSAYATSAVIILAGISGCFMPRDWLPELMRQVSLATPHAWALIGYDEVLTVAKPSLRVVGECCAALLGFAAIFFALGAWRFER